MATSAADVDVVFRLANIWSGMNGRCNSPNQRGWKDYGAKGITLAKVWSSRQGQIRFVKWSLENGWKPGLTIDRKNGKKGYSPENCRWVTHQENCWNRRTNRMLVYKGERKCAAAWGSDPRCVVPSYQFQQRIACGWNIARALTTPLRVYG